MNIVWAALCGAALLGGFVLVAGGFRRMHPTSSTTLSTTLWTRFNAIVMRPSARLGFVGAAAGVIAFAVTGWAVLLPLIPLVTVSLGVLLAAPPQREIALLEALDRWVRSLTATLPTGRSITDAIRVSRRLAPPLLREPIALMVRRLDERWTVPEALRALADELDSPDADAVIAALILAADRGGTGATATLAALAESTQERLRALREIETERAKPRIVVRQITMITMAVLVAALLFGGSFFEPYGTPTGQVILLVLALAYVGSLVMLRRMTVPRRRERILRRQS